MSSVQYAPTTTSTATTVTTAASSASSQTVVQNSPMNYYNNVLNAQTVYPSYGNPSDPNQTLNSKNGQPILRYPLDTPKYFMTFLINEYIRPSILQPIQMAAQQIIVMPMPGNLMDNQVVGFSPTERNSLLGVASEMSAASLMGSAGTKNTGSLAGAAGAIGTRIAEQSLNVFGNIGQAIAQQFGQAANPFLTVQLQGPTFRQHNFEWILSPNTPQETAQLTMIINTFKKYSLPALNMKTNGIYQTYPSIFKPIICPDDSNFFVYKYCVMPNFTVHYSPSGTFASFVGTPAPAVVSINMVLMEIELRFQADFTGKAL